MFEEKSEIESNSGSNVSKSGRGVGLFDTSRAGGGLANILDTLPSWVGRAYGEGSSHPRHAEAIELVKGAYESAYPAEMETDDLERKLKADFGSKENFDALAEQEKEKLEDGRAEAKQRETIEILQREFGENWRQETEGAQKLFQQFVNLKDPATLEFIESSGLGNDPALISSLAKISKRLKFFTQTYMAKHKQPEKPKGEGTIFTKEFENENE
jgi:hypothetical protein